MSKLRAILKSLSNDDEIECFFQSLRLEGYNSAVSNFENTVAKVVSVLEQGNIKKAIDILLEKDLYGEDKKSIIQSDILPSDEILSLGEVPYSSEYNTYYFPVDTKPDVLDELIREGKTLVLYDINMVEIVGGKLDRVIPVCPKCNKKFVKIIRAWEFCAKCRDEENNNDKR